MFLKYPDHKRPDKEQQQLLEMNLKLIFFKINYDVFLQIKGTATDKKFALAYANIFMEEWETSALQKYLLIPFCYIPGRHLGSMDPF